MQRADLEASLDELEKLRDDLTKTVETRFADTFVASSCISTRSLRPCCPAARAVCI